LEGGFGADSLDGGDGIDTANDFGEILHIIIENNIPSSLTFDPTRQCEYNTSGSRALAPLVIADTQSID